MKASHFAGTTLFVLSLVLAAVVHAQDITAALGGNQFSDQFQVKDNSGNVLFLVRGDGKVGINELNPTEYLRVTDSTASDDLPAIYGKHAVTDGYGIGVLGEGKYVGVKGYVNSNSVGGYALYAQATGSGSATLYGIFAEASGGTTNYAGYFNDDVHVAGTLSKAAGSFKIDHPQDPTNRYLSHSFVESPDMKNVYDGVVVLDGEGRAVVQLPGYFEALNKDFRYQLTPIGAPAPGLFIAREISDNQFTIAGGRPHLKVSWQVTGIRNDPYAREHRIQVETDKLEEHKGYYLFPEYYNGEAIHRPAKR